MLMFAFGALVAAQRASPARPHGRVAAFGLQGPISQLFQIDDSVRIVLVLIGMAVGVDYALFYVIRSREERSRGLPSHEALEVTARTSGRTVVVSGTTVIDRDGRPIPGPRRRPSTAWRPRRSRWWPARSLASVTALPGILELLGPRIDRGRIPFLPHLQTDRSALARSGPVVSTASSAGPASRARSLPVSSSA